MTTLVRFREPLRNVAMNSEFERLMKNLFESPARAAGLSSHAWTPPLDVWETEGELVIRPTSPAYLRRRSLLTSSALDGQRLHAGGGARLRYERPFGEFTRSVALPEGTGDGEASAHYANGVLEVHVQKPERSKPRRLAVTTTIESGGSAG